MEITIGAANGEFATWIAVGAGIGVALGVGLSAPGGSERSDCKNADHSPPDGPPTG